MSASVWNKTANIVLKNDQITGTKPQFRNKPRASITERVVRNKGTGSKYV